MTLPEEISDEVSQAWAAISTEERRHADAMKKLVQDLNMAQVKLSSFVAVSRAQASAKGAAK